MYSYDCKDNMAKRWYVVLTNTSSNVLSPTPTAMTGRPWHNSAKNKIN